MYIFASNGEMGEPCGMPRRLFRASVVRVFLPRSSVSSTGQSSHILIRCSTRRSTIRRVTHRLLRIAPRTVGILFWWEVGFKDRFQHQHRCCHADSITQGRDAQRPELAVGLRYEHSSDRVRSISLLPERKRQFAEPPLHPIRLDVRELLTIPTRYAL